MKRKLQALLLCVVMALGVLIPTAAFADTYSPTYTFTIDLTVNQAGNVTPDRSTFDFVISASPDRSDTDAIVDRKTVTLDGPGKKTLSFNLTFENGKHQGYYIWQEAGTSDSDDWGIDSTWYSIVRTTTELVYLFKYNEGDNPEHGQEYYGDTLYFTNTFWKMETGTLTVSKEVSGEGADVNQAFGFTVKALGSDCPLWGTYGDMTFNQEGTATFDLKAGESISASGLPLGTMFYVYENDDEESGYTALGYTVTVNGEEIDATEGWIEDGTPIVVVFNNHKDAEPGEPEPGDPEPGDPEPGDPEPGDPEPGDPEPGDPEPGDPEPGDPEPGDPEPGDPEPGDPEPGDPEPGDPEPGDPEPGDPEPGDPEPGDPEPGDPEPGDPEPGDPEPGNPEPGDPEPGNPEPGDSESGDPTPGNPESNNPAPNNPAPNKPAGGLPQTGDASVSAFWTALTCLVACGFVALGLNRLLARRSK